MTDPSLGRDNGANPPVAPPSWPETDADLERRDVEPWLVAYTAVDERDARHVERLAELARRPGYHLDPTAVVATDARVVASRLELGAHSTIASGCVIRGELRVGAHSSLNAGVVTIGRVTIGNAVRIAGTAVLVGENHVFDDLDTPIALQGLTSDGIVVEDDVWIGAHVTVLDGVTIGAHSVVAAGAVVTRDVPPWSIVAGVPARVMRDRRDRAGHGTARHPVRRDPLDAFAAKVEAQWPDVLQRCRIDADPDGRRPAYVDTPGATWGPRALNDAIEIAAAFGQLPPDADRDELIERVASQQDPATGLFVDPTHPPAWFERASRSEPVTPAEALKPTHHEWDLYGILSCGYALEVLGAAPIHPIRVVDEIDPASLESLLDGLDWGLLAWPSGSWIDAVGTALACNRRHHGSRSTLPSLWGWLTTHVDPTSGMWGRWLAPQPGFDVGWLMAVNGYYRLTRGTYAQFGIELPYPERAIDTVLAHGRANHWFRLGVGRTRPDDPFNGRNACNVLDVVHPLWLLARQRPEYRSAEIRDVLAGVLIDAIDDWVDGAGVPWQVGRDQPGLQGTEMWLSIVYLAADALGLAHGLPWEPRGVHRLAPACSLT